MIDTMSESEHRYYDALVNQQWDEYHTPTPPPTPWYVREARWSTHPTTSTLGTLTHIPF